MLLAGVVGLGLQQFAGLADALLFGLLVGMVVASLVPVAGCPPDR